MYNFIDVNQASESVILPSEALKINGEYIENQISGYRTLHVSGREALAPELTTYTTGVRDGSVMKNKRFPARTITVTYQIVAESSEEYRKAYNKLAAILNVEEAELIFNDEQDKYFVGTPSAIGTPEPGRNAVIGEFEILCIDPFKYSVGEYIVELDNLITPPQKEFILDYGGTYKTYPKFEVEFYKESEVSEDGESAYPLGGYGDCGYIAFINDRKKIIQLGDPGEVDTVFQEAKSETVIHSLFQKESDWGKGAQSLWEMNNCLLGGMFQAIDQWNGSVGMQYVYPPVNDTRESPIKQILSIKSKVGPASTYPVGYPGFTYNVYTKMISRTETTATIQVIVDTSMWKESNYFGYGLVCGLRINEHLYIRDLRRDNDSTWYGKNNHRKVFNITLTGLTSAAGKVSAYFMTQRPDDSGTAGVVPFTKCKDIEYSAYTVTQANKACFLGVPINYKEEASTISRWFRDFNDEAVTDFTLRFDFYFDGGHKKNSQAYGGNFNMTLTDFSGHYICLEVLKGDGTKEPSVVFMVKRSGSESFLLTEDSDVNKRISPININNRNGPIPVTIIKMGNTLSLNLDGKSYSYNVDMDGFTFRQIGFGFITSQKCPMSRLGLSNVTLIKHNRSSFKDIPNKFGSNDILKVDCGSGEILLNGRQTPELGALGNDWEEFCLEPGLNQLEHVYSEWVSDAYAPKVRMRYREVFL